MPYTKAKNATRILLNAMAKKYKNGGFGLVKQLWSNGAFEERVLAAKMLGLTSKKDPDLALTAEVAGDVGGPWSSDAAQLQTDLPIDLGNGFEQVRFTDRTATTNSAQRFMRIRWSLGPALPAAPPRQAAQR